MIRTSELSPRPGMYLGKKYLLIELFGESDRSAN